MGKGNRQSEKHEDLHLPQALVQDLRRLHEPGSPVPDDVDAAIRDTAWRRIEALKRQRRIRRWGQLGVAAAGIALFFWIGRAFEGPTIRSTAIGSSVIAHDIDRSGRVDILDAMALAQHIESGTALDRRWDLTHDGTVDRADVDAVAMAAVRLVQGAS
ncbi:MAG: dockerin type I domain-containing protein [Planctomycetota bacterium]